MQSMTCPYCHKTIELSQALTSEIQSDILKEERERHMRELAEAKRTAVERMLKEVETLKSDLVRKEERLKKAEEAELTIRKEKNALAEEKRSFELEKERQIDREREKIRDKTLEEAAEKHHLREREYEERIEQLKKSLEDAKRKADQGSQQLQGEVQELDLEETLRREFPLDDIEPIGKGVLGADVRHVVKSRTGVICGTILWESKRTKTWSDAWIAKLKSDVLSDRAHIPAIVSEMLPDEAKSGLGVKEGVWIASPKLSVILARLLRKSLIDAAKQKVIAEMKQTTAEQLYGYVTSHEFQHQIEAMIEMYRQMQDQIQKERASFERSWKLREMQVQKLVSGVAGIYGSMQGIAQKALPVIKGLELDAGVTEKDLSSPQSKLIE